MKTVQVLQNLHDGIDEETSPNPSPRSIEQMNALTEAIALATVVEFLDYRHSLSRTSMGFFLTDLKDGTVIIANSITELAERLRSLDKPNG